MVTRRQDFVGNAAKRSVNEAICEGAGADGRHPTAVSGSSGSVRLRAITGLFALVVTSSVGRSLDTVHAIELPLHGPPSNLQISKNPGGSEIYRRLIALYFTESDTISSATHLQTVPITAGAAYHCSENRLCLPALGVNSSNRSLFTAR